MELFTCFSCNLFKETVSNYGWCKMPHIGSIDRAVYQNGEICEMEKRIHNNKLLSKRINGKISHEEMYERWRR